MLTDTEVVEAFIEDSLRGRETLQANPLLKSECLRGINELISKQDGLLIKVDIHQQPIEFLVRHGTAYEDWLHDLFQRHQFITTDRSGSDRFYRYRRFQVLPGYQVNCESARQLWKSWRTLRRMTQNREKAKALMIQGGQSWTEVQSMTVSNEMLFINTPEGEVVTHMSDAVFWLSQPALATTQKKSYWKRRYGLR